MLPSSPSRARLERISRRQIEREGWPRFEELRPERFPLEARRRAASQWQRRAEQEYGSIHEFTLLSHALTYARAPLSMLGALARLITDEVRHAELASRMARALLPEEGLGWEPPGLPFLPPPLPEGDREESDRGRLLAWAAEAILCSCCIGESLSLPLYQALQCSITEEVPRAVVAQILKDERLHSVFGWESLAHLLPELTEAHRAWLQRRLGARLAGFEKSCSGDIRLEEVAGTELTLTPPGPDAPPNLGHLDRRVYVTIFYATLESEILPGFEGLGFDAMGAWRERQRDRSAPLLPP